MSGTAIVTGGGTGVGRAAALALARRGFVVAVAGRRAGPLEQVVAEIEAVGGEAIAIVADVSDEAAVAAMFDKSKESFGRVDVVFNNAGLPPPRVLFEDLPLEDWRRLIDVNLTGIFLCMRQAFRVMKAQQPQGGRIINNGSLSAQVPRPDSAPYTATKHGVSGLTKTASLDGRKYNIAVGQIDIGNTESEMATRFVSTGGMLQPNGDVLIEPFMVAEYVGEAVATMAGLPLDVNIQLVTMLPSAMPFVGRG